MVFAERVPTLHAPSGAAGRSGDAEGAGPVAAGLSGIAGRARPVVLAGERRLPVPGPLGELLPGGLQRGTVVAVEGSLGAGAASLVLWLAASATAVGEWAAIVDLDGTLGALAAAEAGVALERLAVVRKVTPACFGRVVATMVEGVSLVAAAIPPYLRPADARRLAARVRERGAVLVAAGRWPGESALRLRAESSVWTGLGWGEGLLEGRVLRVALSGRGAAGRERTVELAAAGMRPAPPPARAAAGMSSAPPGRAAAGAKPGPPARAAG